MNERIRELAEQATTLSFDVDHTEREVDLEKFAELIVKDCANYIQHFYGDIAASSIGNDIKLHFGIEQ